MTASGGSIAGNSREADEIGWTSVLAVLLREDGGLEGGQGERAEATSERQRRMRSLFECEMSSDRDGGDSMARDVTMVLEMAEIGARGSESKGRRHRGKREGHTAPTTASRVNAGREWWQLLFFSKRRRRGLQDKNKLRPRRVGGV